VIEWIEFDGVLWAIVLRREFDRPGIHFLTEPSCNLQLAHMSHPKGHSIEPHYHPRQERTIHGTSEVLLVKSGSIRVDFFTEEGSPRGNVSLVAGDAILLTEGAHGIEMVEPSSFIEVKQGPFLEGGDKIKLGPSAASHSG
jgi:mannose-6-phosphate isomerase-like protein (cupin superfamily)